MLFAILPYNSFATTACVENDTVAVVLDPYLEPSSITPAQSNTGDRFWVVGYSSGMKLVGDSACLSSNYGLNNFEIYAKDNGNLKDNGLSVLGGEQQGLYCFCKLTYPAVSYWIFRDSHSQPEYCFQSCAYYCASYSMNNHQTHDLIPVDKTTYRKALFGTVNDRF